MDSWTRIATIPCLIGYSPRLNDLLIYDSPTPMHPNMFNYDHTAVIPAEACGICRIPALSLGELGLLGQSVLHTNPESHGDGGH